LCGKEGRRGDIKEKSPKEKEEDKRTDHEKNSQ